MRYDTPIYFQRIVQGEYDPSTGNYGKDEVVETSRDASVMDTGEKMLQLVYGSLKQGSLTVQLQSHYNGIFDRIRIGDKVYRADFNRRLRNKQVFVISEVQ